MMTAADHHLVGEVGFAAWRSSDAFRDSGLPEDRLEQVRLAYERFPSEAEGKITLAEMDGRVAGWTARDSEPDYISDLWVAPTYQGRGIGRALVEYLLSVMRQEGVAVARIHTHASNAGAIRLYQRCGFTIVWRGLEYSQSLGMDHEKVHLHRALSGD